MGHPDFRVGGRIFATLGYPSAGFGTLVLSPQVQDIVLPDHPKAFAPAAGAWGRSGSTVVNLRLAPRRAVTLALESAWRRGGVAAPSAQEPTRGLRLLWQRSLTSHSVLNVTSSTRGVAR